MPVLMGIVLLVSTDVRTITCFVFIDFSWHELNGHNISIEFAKEPRYSIVCRRYIARSHDH